MNLKNTIYKKRKEKNMSQEELAEQIGVARQTISKWETGETIPDVESLKKIAITLDFSIDEILGLERKNDEDENLSWLIIVCMLIGNIIGLIINNFIIGYISTMIAFIIDFVFQIYKKK